MDAIARTFHQCRVLFLSMSKSQRWTMVAVPVLILGALLYLMFNHRSSSHVPASWGKVFTPDELSHAEQVLLDQDMTDFHRHGQRLMVPADDVDRYNAALLEGGGFPDGYATELEQQLDNQSLFQSDRQSEARKDIARARELRRILTALPSIEDASVVWARSESGRWPRRHASKVTATVSIKPRDNRDLRPHLVHSIRNAVAKMVPDLEPQNVTVFDLVAERAYTADSSSQPTGSRMFERAREFKYDYEQQIGEALSYIPGVLVTVNVDLEQGQPMTSRSGAFGSVTEERPSDDAAELTDDEVFRPGPKPGVHSNQGSDILRLADSRSVATRQNEEAGRFRLPANDRLTENEIFAARPGSVQVSISIPEEFYEQVAIGRGLQPGDTEPKQAAFTAAIRKIEAEEKAKAQSVAQRLIPAHSPADAVTVNSVARVASVPVTEPDAPVANAFWQRASQGVGIAGLVLFALWAIWMSRKSRPNPSAISDHADSSTSAAMTHPKDATPSPDQGPMSRDQTPSIDREVSSKDQFEVVHGVADRKQSVAEVVRNVENSLHERTSDSMERRMETDDGLAENAGSLIFSGGGADTDFKENFDHVETGRGDANPRRMLVFDDLLQFDNSAIQVMLEEVDERLWPVALKGASQNLQARILEILSPRAAELLRQEMEFLGPVKLSDVEATQRRIVDVVRRLEDSGAITVASGRQCDRFAWLRRT